LIKQRSSFVDKNREGRGFRGFGQMMAIPNFEYGGDSSLL
jgi:hypothetical protein